MDSDSSITHQQVMFEKIYAMLARGEFAPGEMLSRRRLAEQLEMNPSSVQHVLGRLEGMGLVERRPQSGTYLRMLNDEEIEQTQDLRELVEPYLACRAATRMTPIQKRKLRETCQQLARIALRMAKAAPTTALDALVLEAIEVEYHFHGIIAAAGQNQQAAEVVQRLGILLRSGIPKQKNSRQLTCRIADATIVQHREIYDALAASNPNLAEQRMRSHVLAARFRAKT